MREQLLRNFAPHPKPKLKQQMLTAGLQLGRGGGGTEVSEGR